MSKREIIETAVQLGRLGFGSWSIQRLMRHERTLHHLDERRCNEPMDDGFYEKRVASIVAKAQTICDEAACDEKGARMFVVYHQSDPRGGALYVVPQAILRGRSIDACYNDGVCV